MSGGTNGGAGKKIGTNANGNANVQSHAAHAQMNNGGRAAYQQQNDMNNATSNAKIFSASEQQHLQMQQQQYAQAAAMHSFVPLWAIRRLLSRVAARPKSAKNCGPNSPS